jgi:hypothetical protein
VGTGPVRVPGRTGSTGNRPNRSGSQRFRQPCVRLAIHRPACKSAPAPFRLHAQAAPAPSLCTRRHVALQDRPPFSLFGWLVADGWCWFILREEYCWLVDGGSLGPPCIGRSRPPRSTASGYKLLLCSVGEEGRREAIGWGPGQHQRRLHQQPPRSPLE